jgi:hypothetical protein
LKNLDKDRVTVPVKDIFRNGEQYGIIFSDFLLPVELFETSQNLRVNVQSCLAEEKVVTPEKVLKQLVKTSTDDILVLVLFVNLTEAIKVPPMKQKFVIIELQPEEFAQWCEKQTTREVSILQL